MRYYWEAIKYFVAIKIVTRQGIREIDTYLWALGVRSD